MTFFNYSPTGGQGFRVSRWFWLYVVITIPLTAMVFLAWQVWLRNGRRTSIEHENRLGDIELGPAGSELPRDIFGGLKYSDPTSRPADVETVAEGGDGKMEEDPPDIMWR